MKDKMVGGIISSVLGDVLGVPVEFNKRSKLRKHPVVDFRDYGTYNQPKGTWSDDSSLLLCTLESLLTGIDYNKTMKLFYDWYSESYWTANDEIFDIGTTTRKALDDFMRGRNPIRCGLVSNDSIGNGSLMRILPIAYEVFDKSIKTRIETSFNYSCLTHGHIRCRLACWLYVEIVRNILYGHDKISSVDNAFKIVTDGCLANQLDMEWKHFINCNSNILTVKDIESLRSSGYVIDTLESSIYSFLSNDSIIDSVLFSVNLGGDTDTIASVTGGLSGTFYGINSLDQKWIDRILKIREIKELIDKYLVVRFS